MRCMVWWESRLRVLVCRFINFVDRIFVVSDLKPIVSYLNQSDL